MKHGNSADSPQKDKCSLPKKGHKTNYGAWWNNNIVNKKPLKVEIQKHQENGAIKNTEEDLELRILKYVKNRKNDRLQYQ